MTCGLIRSFNLINVLCMYIYIHIRVYIYTVYGIKHHMMCMTVYDLCALYVSICYITIYDIHKIWIHMDPHHHVLSMGPAASSDPRIAQPGRSTSRNGQVPTSRSTMSWPRSGSRSPTVSWPTKVGWLL